jgi:dienelactone hydrolase
VSLDLARLPVLSLRLRRSADRLAGIALAALLTGLALTVAGADRDAARASSISVRLAAAERDTQVAMFHPAGSPLGLVVIAHGFSRAGDRHADLAQALARAGFLVAVPDLPHFSNHAANGLALRDITHAVSRTMADAPADLPIVLVGFSAGGLASLLAAGEVAGLAGWIGLDPVDLRGRGEAAAAAVNVPSLVLRAPPSNCNADGNGARIAAALRTRGEDVMVAGASHCDFEDPSTLACTIACGPDDPARREAIRDAVVAAALAMVQAKASSDDQNAGVM